MLPITKREGWGIDFLLFVLCIFFYLHVPVVLVDDAFIAYRYAANLVHGLGLVFNAGQRVEGISDLSWTVLMAIPELLHIRPELFAIFTGVVSAAAAFVIVRRLLVSKLGVPSLLASGVVGLAAFNSDFWVMAGNGVESGLYSLVLTGSFALLLQRRFIFAGALLGVGATLRPECLALAPLTLACVFLIDLRRRRSLRGALEQALSYRHLLLVWSAIVLGVLLWRHAYYGVWVQNTLIAKSHLLQMSDLRAGLSYGIRFAVRSAPWLMTAALVLWLETPPMILAGLAWFAFEVAVALPNAGDWMPGYRLISVYIPLLAFVSAFAIDRIFVTQRSRAISLITITALCCAAQMRDRGWTLRRGLLDRHERAEMFAFDEGTFMQLAGVIQPALLPSDVVAPEELGIFSYVLANVTVHDWLGLTDAHIARYGTIVFPMFGKAEPAYSVKVIAPTLFVLVRGDNTLRIFQRETAGDFGKRYRFWLVSNKPERIMLAIRADRESAIVAAVSGADLKIQAIHPEDFIE